MENTILRRTKILYDPCHFVIVALIQASEGYAIVTQIDELTMYVYCSSENYNDAYELYHECLVDIFSTTFDELMEDVRDHELVEKAYEETLDALNLSKELFGHKKPSEIFDNIQDMSRVELVMKHPTFKS